MCASDRRARAFRLLALRWLVVACLPVLAVDAVAQQSPSREQEQIRRLRQQVQQLQQEQAGAQQQRQQAEAEQRRAAAERQDLEAGLRRSRGEIGNARTEARLATERAQQLEQQLSAARAESQALQDSLTATRAQLQQAQAALAQTQARLGTLQAAHAELNAAHRDRGDQLGRATSSNLALHRLGVELLDRYRNKGVAEALATQEPFLQTKRVELENLVQDYRDRLDGERLRPAPAGSAKAP